MRQCIQKLNQTMMYFSTINTESVEPHPPPVMVGGRGGACISQILELAPAPYFCLHIYDYAAHCYAEVYHNEWAYDGTLTGIHLRAQIRATFLTSFTGS